MLRIRLHQDYCVAVKKWPPDFGIVLTCKKNHLIFINSYTALPVCKKNYYFHGCWNQYLVFGLSMMLRIQCFAV